MEETEHVEKALCSWSPSKTRVSRLRNITAASIIDSTLSASVGLNPIEFEWASFVISQETKPLLDITQA